MVRAMTQQSAPLTLAILGRPNVGKSTLFNRLAGRALALVHDKPGVTRDWREAEGWISDVPLRIIDTAGLEEDPGAQTLGGQMQRKSFEALDRADAALFVIDGRAGIMPADRDFAQVLRRQRKPVILIVNKCENDKITQSAVAEGYGLGLGDPVPFSAAHGEGLEGLYHALALLFPDQFREADEDAADISGAEKLAESWPQNLDAIEGDEDFDFSAGEAPDAEEEMRAIRVTLCGRPNVGKSTLLNAILKEERVIVSPEAGTTRDSISVDWVFEGRKFQLVDTAGLRKKARVVDALEKLSVEDTMRAVRLSQVAVFVVDATRPFERQDLSILEHILSEGRMPVVALNKWDLIEDKKAALEEIQFQLSHIGQIKNMAVVPLSALRGSKVPDLMRAVLRAFSLWDGRVSTATLNRWLRTRCERHPPPLVSGRPNKIRYMTQIKRRPPTFALWVSQPDKLPDSYIRYLTHALCEDFDLPGVPVRMVLRKSSNPFSGRD